MRLRFLTALLFVLPVAFGASCQQKKEIKSSTDWALGPFARPDGVNPLITPSKASFYCPLTKDLIHWVKSGPVFKKAFDGKFADRFSKSASIVTTLKDGTLVISKIKGKYLMYWGEKNVFAATSTDLVNLESLVDKNKDLIPLASPRPKFFDSELTECGPPAVLTKDGIILILIKSLDHEF